MNDLREEEKQSKYKKHLLLSSNLNLQGFATNEFIEISWSFSIFCHLNFDSCFPNLILQLHMRLNFYVILSRIPSGTQRSVSYFIIPFERNEPD